MEFIHFIKEIKETAFKTLMITVFKNSNTFSPTCNKNQLNDNACKLPHIQCAHCGKKLGCAFELTGISTGTNMKRNTIRTASAQGRALK